MTPPFLFSGATLLFWGWQTGLILPAMAMALVLEASRSVKTKWDLSLSDFNRIADICTILLACLVVFVVTTNSITSMMIVFKWLPVVFFPLLAAQEYSVAGKIDIRSLMLSARKKAADADRPPRTVQLSYPYAVLCILSAGGANLKGDSYYLGLLLLTAWVLWPQRPRRFSSVWWVLLLAVVGGMGYVGHIGLYRLQGIVMDLTGGWLTAASDPFQRSTSIGDIGELKLSDRIAFRITPESDPFQPILVRESAYNLYRGSTWYSSPTQFTDLAPEPDRSTWKLRQYPGTGKAFTVWASLKNGRGVLKLPLGAYQLGNLPEGQLMRTPLGAVKVEEGPGLIGYRISYNADTARDLSPAQTDLVVPANELPAVLQVVEELDLKSKRPGEIVRLLADFFEEQFSYSLKLHVPEKGKTSIATFLLSSRTGHCEYFATATVLILRACGIPARYASGWSAHEFSRLEEQIVVRKRHAHAWTLVYLDGTWRNLDTTSSSWIGIEDKASSKLSILHDLWSLLLFKFSQWRWGTGREELKKWWWLLLVPLVIILVRRMYVRKKIQRVRTDTEKKTDLRFSQGQDSVFYRIEQRLKELGFARNPWETPVRWIRRIEEAGAVVHKDIRPCLALHYQNRFGMNGLTVKEQARLEEEAEGVLKKLEKVAFTL